MKEGGRERRALSSAERMLSCGCSSTLGTRSTGGKKGCSPLFVSKGKRSNTLFSRSTLTLNALGEGNGQQQHKLCCLSDKGRDSRLAYHRLAGLSYP